MSVPGVKRPADHFSGALVQMKRPRQELVATSGDVKRQQIIASGPPRTSSLEAPIMQLFGHEGEIYSAKFSPAGSTLASGGFDRLIYLWKVYGECENYAVLKGHSGPILELQYSADGTTLFSASVDKSSAMWDCEVGVRLKRFRGHTSFVNTCCPMKRGEQLLVTGSDDGTVKLWDTRYKSAVQSFNNTFQVTAVCFNETGDWILSSGVDNEIKVWDLRRNEVAFSMKGHSDTITGLRLSPSGNYVLSNSMDNTVRVWDVRPFAPGDRQLKLFLGVQHNFEKNLLRCSWSPDGRKIASGSADRFVYVWDAMTQQLIYKLPGHRGSVNDVDFHPSEPILLSCSSDKTLYLGELQ
ncbi:hypothetical protein EMCRGX_G014595 [Ephydatia muelleri]|eukprot:Em0005g1376a